MSTLRSRVQEFLFRCAVPVICSLIVGFAFSGADIFDRHYGAFQFLWSAVVASVFYHLQLTVRPRDAWLGLMILFGLTLLTTQSSRPAFLLRDVFYVAAITASILVYVRFARRSEEMVFFYPALMFAGVYGTFNVIGAEVHLWILRTFVMENTGGDAVSLASMGAYFGVLIGFAVGLGFAINERLIPRRNPGPQSALSS